MNGTALFARPAPRDHSGDRGRQRARGGCGSLPGEPEFGGAISAALAHQRDVSPDTFGGYKGYALAGHEQPIRRWIAERPDITLAELGARWQSARFRLANLRSRGSSIISVTLSGARDLEAFSWVGPKSAGLSLISLPRSTPIRCDVVPPVDIAVSIRQISVPPSQSRRMGPQFAIHWQYR